MSFSEENQQFIDHYLEKLSEGKMHPGVFFGFIGVLLLIFIVRFFILYGIEKKKMKHKYDLKNTTVYIISHTSIEFAISLFVCYILVKLTDAVPTNYMTNFILSPIAGALIGVYLDNKVFIPIETATGFGSKLMKSGSKKEEKKQDDKNITININQDKKDNKEEHLDPVNILNSIPKTLDDTLADSDDFSTEIIHAVNEIKQENASQNKIILSNTKKLDITVETLAILKESEMINKKIELKKLIYECLNQGFATPEQNDKITMLYESYEALGGNHEVKSLYFHHYLSLPVRVATADDLSLQLETEDPIVGRNIRTIYEHRNNTGNLNAQGLNTPTRLRKRIYSYGEFDSESE